MARAKGHSRWDVGHRALGWPLGKGTVYFSGAEFSGGTVNFGYAEFSGGTVDFSNPRRWSQPPVFDWEGAPSAGVILPVDADATPA